MPEFRMTNEYTYEGVAALLLIKTKPGMAPEVAEHVAELNEEEAFEGGYTVRGVRWTASVAADPDTEGIDQVVANVKVPSDDALNELIQRIHNVDGVVNPTLLTLDHYYVTRRGHNTLPY